MHFVFFFITFGSLVLIAVDYVGLKGIGEMPFNHDKRG